MWWWAAQVFAEVRQTYISFFSCKILLFSLSPSLFGPLFCHRTSDYVLIEELPRCAPRLSSVSESRWEWKSWRASEICFPLFFGGGGYFFFVAHEKKKKKKINSNLVLFILYFWVSCLCPLFSPFGDRLMNTIHIHTFRKNLKASL